MQFRIKKFYVLIAVLCLGVALVSPVSAACNKPSPPGCINKKGKFGGQFEFLDCKSLFDSYIKEVNRYAGCLQEDTKGIEAAFKKEAGILEAEFKERMSVLQAKYKKRGAPFQAKFDALKRETDAAAAALKARVPKRSTTPLN